MALYAAFSGALDLLSQIDEDAARIMVKAPALTPIEPADYKLPCISALPKYCGGARTPDENETETETVQFRMFLRHPDTQPDRLLYVAEISDESDHWQPEQIIIVKFTRTYSIELHAFCASRGHAPRILGFGHLPGGWSAVAMEHISPNVHPSRSPDLARLCDRWGDDLRQLMRSFHDSDFVHGDLRESNVLCDGERVVLIDFDWGGKVGVASYPTARLCSELRDGRQDTSPKITKDDDRRVLQNTLSELRKLAHS